LKTTLTANFVKTATAEPGKDRSIYWDTTMPGFGLAVMQSGARSFVVQYRAAGVSRRLTLPDTLSLEDAKREARKRLGEVAGGRDPLTEERAKVAAAKAAKANTLRIIAADYFKREGSKIRTMKERISTFERLVFPKLGDRPIDQIQRSDIVRVLDSIEDERGPVMADKTLAFLTRFFAWHSARTDSFRSPIVRGMARTKPHERARARILNDAEIVAVLRAAEAQPDAFSSLVRFLLLTAARRSEASNMTWGEIVNGAWTIPASRVKVKKEMEMPLSAAAQAVLANIPRIQGCPYVFATGAAKRPMTNFGNAKARLDATSGVSGWTLHDLRRTARSLMSRAHVDSDIAEMCLGHVLNGVRGVYDRHAYFDEKKLAFEVLAQQVEKIIKTTSP
jgi:integrase